MNSIIQFYSKSADKQDLGKDVPANYRKMLSNFYTIDLEIDGEIYPSGEHYFQAMKYKLASNKPSVYKKFLKHGEIITPNDAKRTGGKGGFNRHGAVLDVQKWNHHNVDVNSKIITAKIFQYPIYKHILKSSGKSTLVHYENTRGREPSFWGAVVKSDGQIHGENMLGKSWMCARDSLDLIKNDFL